MDRLNKLTETLNELSRLAKAIIQKLLPLMEEINEPGNDFIKNLKMKGCELTDAKATKLLQDAVIKLTEEAKSVQKELPIFSASVARIDKSLQEAKCPFMKEVWYGDMYGSDELEGFLSLKLDLEKQLETADEDKILDLAIYAYKSEKTFRWNLGQ
uniref:Uncharacterized protein n=1 Tax=Marseillevirus LCMAC101 TaxID=2506602 RepID=A0A481YRF9_9VIRU|nr:MAG: uncharacterized protein LCMAC101_00940 [Marseillevirus LCMAC101]